MTVFVLAVHLAFAVGTLVTPVSALSAERGELVDCGPAGLALLDKTEASRQIPGCDAAAEGRGLLALGVVASFLVFLLTTEVMWRRGTQGMQ